MDRGVQKRRGMHRLFFSIKRVHWMWQRKAREIIGEMIGPGLITPAQFNLLRTLYTYRHGIVRFKLARLLGVAAPGVSRMVKMLEERGLVFRYREDSDRRCVFIELTELGLEAVEDILGVEGREDKDADLDRWLEEEAAAWFASTELARVELAVLDDFLIRARVRQLDPAIYPVPWHGGEVHPWEPGTIAEPPPTRFRVAA